MTIDGRDDLLPESLQGAADLDEEWLEIDCPACETTIEVPRGETAVECPECEATTYFPACSHCRHITAVAVTPGTTLKKACAECFEMWSISRAVRGIKVTTKGIEVLMTCADLLDEEEDRRASTGPLPCRFTTVGGYGWSEEPGTVVAVHIGADSMRLGALTARTVTTVRYEDLLALDFRGGAAKKGGGFIGGGFGLTGALEGMVVASVLNALTTRTRINSIVRISGRAGETVLHVADVMPEHLRTMFAPAVNAIGARQLPARRQQPPAAFATAQALPPPETDIIAKLERLATLHDAGHLTDEEFAADKQILLKDAL